MTTTEMHNAEVETAILAAFMFDSAIVKPALAIIKPDDFYSAENAVIANGCYSLMIKSTPIDAITLIGELEAHGLLEKAGGRDRVLEIAASFYTSAHALHHAQELKRLSEKRKITAFASEIVRGDKPPTVQTLQTAAKDFEKFSLVADASSAAMAQYDEFDKNLTKPIERIKTGLPTLDGKIGGFAVPSVAVIGAYSSTGKTAFALNVAIQQSDPVVFFSLEMATPRIIERIAAAQLKMNYSKFYRRNFDSAEHQEILEITQCLRRMKFHIFDDKYYIEQHESIIATVKPKLVVVDYLQLARTHHKAESKRLEIDHISQFYHETAKRHNCVILLLSQLSRPSKHVKNHNPTMGELKESGGIENDADFVGILHRPYVLNKNDKTIREEEGYLLLDKNRYGITGKLDLEFIGKYQQFYEVDPAQAQLNKKYAQRGKTE